MLLKDHNVLEVFVKVYWYVLIFILYWASILFNDALLTWHTKIFSILHLLISLTASMVYFWCWWNKIFHFLLFFLRKLYFVIDYEFEIISLTIVCSMLHFDLNLWFFLILVLHCFVHWLRVKIVIWTWSGSPLFDVNTFDKFTVSSDCQTLSWCTFRSVYCSEHETNKDE